MRNQLFAQAIKEARIRANYEAMQADIESEREQAAVERGSMHNNLNTVCKYVEALRGRLAIVPEETPDDPHCQFIEFEE